MADPIIHERVTLGAEELIKKQAEHLESVRAGWRKNILADRATSKDKKKLINKVRKVLVLKGQRREFNKFMKATGTANNPVFLRLLHHAASLLPEDEDK